MKLETFLGYKFCLIFKIIHRILFCNKNSFFLLRIPSINLFIYLRLSFSSKMFKFDSKQKQYLRTGEVIIYRKYSIHIWQNIYTLYSTVRMKKCLSLNSAVKINNIGWWRGGVVIYRINTPCRIYTPCPVQLE